MSVNLFRKERPKKEPVSFVALVKEAIAKDSDEFWSLGLPSKIHHTSAMHNREAMLMNWYEEGVLPRIESCPELYE
jgi:hypothetical protein